MYCISCRTELPDIASFCYVCGTPQKALVNVDASPPPATLTQPYTHQVGDPATVVDGEFRTITSPDEPLDLPEGAGVLMIYGNERLKERIVRIDTVDREYVSPDFPGYKPYCKPEEERIWVDQVMRLHPLFKDWKLLYNTRFFPREYSFSKTFRIKQQRLGPFSFVGVRVVVHAGFYEAEFDPDGYYRDTSDIVMVEPGEVTEIRDFERSR